MASDYKKIAEENITRYGTDVREYGPTLLAKLYSDRTHFIYELLQNAEDAGATKVDFVLKQDHLLVSHNGRLFDEADVRGICGLVKGTKAGDLTKIGKFGIGFKSVFGYTQSPEIHSGHEHFLIKNYVRPEAASPRNVPHGNTLFIFPFDHPEISATNAFNQIRGRLSTLEPRILLFLRSTVEVTWADEKGMWGVYLRRSTQRGTSSQASVIRRDRNGELKEEWLVFQRPVQADTGETLRVEVAFRLEKGEDTKIENIVRANNTQLVVFFPTEKPTNLGFLVQGPYRTTPARDNIPNDDLWNINLVQETASLVTESLHTIKQMGLLSVDFLESLPIDEPYYNHYGMFHPVFEAVKEELKQKPLLPSYEGGYVPGNKALLARGTGLRELLSSRQLESLFELSRDVEWLSDKITEDKARKLYAYLRREVEVQEITPENLAHRLDLRFIEKQEDQWLAKFYGFLAHQEALWRASRNISELPGPLRSKPFIRLESGEHVTPFREDGFPSAYLPSEEETEFPTVKYEIVADPQAREFLEEKLGFSKPDIVAEVLERILPKYEKQLAENITDTEHQRDIVKIFRAMETDSLSKRDELRLKLNGTPFLFATNLTTRERALKRPIDIYIHRKEFEAYFEGAPNVWFIDEATIADQATLNWSILGVENKPWLIECECHLSSEERWALRDGDGRGYELQMTDYDLDGLTHFLKRLKSYEPSEARRRSAVLWNLLVEHLQSLPDIQSKEEFFKGECLWSYYSNRTTSFDAAWVMRLREAPWLVSHDDDFYKPCDLSIDDLPREFTYDSILASALQMRPAAVAALAREVGIDVDDLDLMRKNPNEFAKLAAALRERLRIEEGESDNGSEEREAQTPIFRYRDFFRKVFSRSETGERIDLPLQGGHVDDPKTRREHIQQEIGRDRNSEPAYKSRLQIGFKKVHESKDSSIRFFMREQYGGRCQICNYTFVKRDGEPYFEGLYLVSRTSAQWLDRPGNVLCLCANCCAKFLYGPVEASDVVEQIMEFRAFNEGGTADPVLRVTLCDQPTKIRFSERHMLDLQELLKV